MPDFEIVPPSSLKPNQRNPRNNASAIDGVATSIREFGFQAPILARRDGTVVAGHTRLAAALKLGLSEVPVLRVDLDDARATAYSLADNKLGEVATWDDGKLTALVRDLAAEDVDLLAYAGFSDVELARLLDSATDGAESLDDPITPAQDPWVKAGDLFQLGRHRLACLDAFDDSSLARLLGGVTPFALITDPPYGVSEPTNRATRGRGNLTASYDFPPVIGDQTVDAAVRAYQLAVKIGVELTLLWGANHFADRLPAASSWVVWDKRDGVASDDNADCELAWSDRGGPARVFSHLWKGAIKASERDERRCHPTQKPVALCRWTLDIYPKRPVHSVLDPFSGSGSMLLAAEQSGATAYACDIEPRYVQVALERWERLTGAKANRLTDDQP
jgi:site-specific DNA-methyltransferase (adenine-specific)